MRNILLKNQPRKNSESLVIKEICKITWNSIQPGYVPNWTAQQEATLKQRKPSEAENSIRQETIPDMKDLEEQQRWNIKGK
jgi:hypothetical protein